MILKFQNWCLTEESISFRGTTATNVVRDIFTGDILKLKEFMQKNLTEQDLIFLGAGEQGFTFYWRYPKPLTEEFKSKGFLGKENERKDKVIKITSNLNEVEIVKSYIRRFKGEDIPGLASYFWIKEIYLPKDKTWSSIFGPPEKEVFLKYTPEDNPDIPSRTKSTKDSISVSAENPNTRKILSQMRIDKIWIICLEKLRMLTEKEEDIWKFISVYDYPIMSNKEEFDKWTIINFYNWIMTSEAQTNFKEIIEMIPDDKIYWKSVFEKNKISSTDLVQWFERYFKLYENSEAYEFSTDDLHTRNLGFRKNELVVFDCM